jgi:hypothetical protein
MSFNLSVFKHAPYAVALMMHSCGVVEIDESATIEMEDHSIPIVFLKDFIGFKMDRPGAIFANESGVHIWSCNEEDEKDLKEKYGEWYFSDTDARIIRKSFDMSMVLNQK